MAFDFTNGGESMTIKQIINRLKRLDCSEAQNFELIVYDDITNQWVEIGR